jgi:hypothetical protein
MKESTRNEQQKRRMAQRVAKKLTKHNNLVQTNGMKVEAFVWDNGEVKDNTNVLSEKATPFVSSEVEACKGELFDSKVIFEPDPDDNYGPPLDKLHTEKAINEAAFSLIEKGFAVRVVDDLRMKLCLGSESPPYHNDMTPLFKVSEVEAVRGVEFSTTFTLKLRPPGQRYTPNQD